MPDATQGGGWRGGENRSDLLVLDACGVDRAPLATVQFSHRLPFGFHGNFVAAA